MTEKQAGPDWAALLVAYGEGASDVEIAKKLKITIARFYSLCEEVPSFAEFAERGRTLAQAYWYEVGRTALFDKSLNVTLYTFIMKNRYGWADKVESTDTTNSDPVNLDQAKGALATALKRLGKKNPELLNGARLYEPSTDDNPKSTP